MKAKFLESLARETEVLRERGLFKAERLITSPQQGLITVKTAAGEGEYLNFCANNYLGLSNHPEVLKAAQDALPRWGFGMSSVRFICGTQDLHRELEGALSDFLKTEDTILFSSCFDANGGLFEALLGPEDAIISDALNHASIIDGVRLCKARRYRYKNNNMEDLESKLKEAKAAGCRYQIIATDGVFSMDGIIADLEGICDLAERYDALVMVDDSHAVGFMGEHGRGSHEHRGVIDRVDILTGTLGKALGGASGGYVSGRQEIIAWRRQRARPYLFSNSLAPAIVATSLEVLKLLKEGGELLERLWRNTDRFREGMSAAGFELAGQDHPIIPVMLGDARLAGEMAERLLDEGIYVIGFSFPVVPKEQARIRVQISAGHELEHIERAIAAFTKVGRELGVI